MNDRVFTARQLEVIALKHMDSASLCLDRYEQAQKEGNERCAKVWYQMVLQHTAIYNALDAIIRGVE